MINQNKRGITLIALIITIIVMLILVGVTINIAVNGDIFGKAREAARKTEKRVIYDEIVASMVMTDSGMIDPYETAIDAKTILESEGREIVLMLESSNCMQLFIVVNGNGEDTDDPNDAEEPGYGEEDDYAYLITHSRIIMDEDMQSDESGSPILTWADLGITNLTKNTKYVCDSLELYFNEDADDGISVEDQNGLFANGWDNDSIFINIVFNCFTISEENHLIWHAPGDETEVYCEFIFEGDVIRWKNVTIDPDNFYSFVKE